MAQRQPSLEGLLLLFLLHTSIGVEEMMVGYGVRQLRLVFHTPFGDHHTPWHSEVLHDNE